MKKNIISIIIGIIIVSIIFVFVLAVINNNKETKGNTSNDSDYIAMIYHSEMRAMDDGVEYTYYIYESSNNKGYYYIKTKSNITIAGSGEKSKVGRGSVNNKNDLDKITKDIDSDSNINSLENYIVYSYVENGKNIRLDSISELGNKLFK